MYNIYLNFLNKTKKYNFFKYIPIIIYLLYIIILHFFISTSFGDDNFFSIKGNLFNIIYNRYNTWTSRIFIETILILILTYLKFMWKIINILILILIYYSLNKILNRKNETYISYSITFMLMLYPFIHMKSAGWATTTINYLWTLGLGLFVLIYVIKELNNEKYNKKILLLTIPSLLFATNNEQICALYFGYLTLFNIYCYLKNKKINKTLILYLIITIASLILIITCPGNKLRVIQETNNWFKDYNSLSLIDKSLLSINNTYLLILGKYKFNFLFILMSSLSTYTLIKNKSNKLYKAISIVFLIGSILIPMSDIYKCSDLYYIHYNNSKVIPYLQMNSTTFILSIIISLLYTLFYTYTLYYLFNKDKYLKFFIPIIFIAGLLSRFIIGFSPTIFSSSTRTGIYMYFSFIIINLLLIKNIKPKKKEKFYLNLFITFLFIGFILLEIAKTFIL